MLPVLMALQAEIELAGPGGARRIPVEEMIIGYRRTACRPDELITRVFIPSTARDVIIRSYKVSRRHDMDISTVSAGFRLERDEQETITRVLLVFGGMADQTRRAVRTELFLCGKQWSRPVVEEAMEVLIKEFAPLNDVRGSAEFRKTVARNLLLKFWDDTSASSKVRCLAEVEA
jgi:xanthine dehydrogenase iron-sulfur cluster and FAD-binding subunit A